MARGQPTALFFAALLLSMHVPSSAERGTAALMRDAQATGEDAPRGNSSSEQLRAPRAAEDQVGDLGNLSMQVAVVERSMHLAVVGNHFEVQPNPFKGLIKKTAKIRKKVADALGFAGVTKTGLALAGQVASSTVSLAFSAVGLTVAVTNTAIKAYKLIKNRDQLQKCEIMQELGGLAVSAVGIGVSIAAIAVGGLGLAIGGIVTAASGIAARHGLFDRFCGEVEKSIRKCMNDNDLPLRDCEKSVMGKIDKSVEEAQYDPTGGTEEDKELFEDAQAFCLHGEVEGGYELHKTRSIMNLTQWQSDEEDQSSFDAEGNLREDEEDSPEEEGDAIVVWTNPEFSDTANESWSRELK